MTRFIILAALFLGNLSAQPRNLLNGHDLSNWDVRGEGLWTLLHDGTLAGQRTPDGAGQLKTWPLAQADYRKWLNQQAWLYTKEEFGDFDLHVEYWIPIGGNSGVSIRDASRGQYSFGLGEDGRKTPAHIGYEIQILGSGYADAKYPSGSIYLFAAAKTGLQQENDWNSMDIESRRSVIRVRLNGSLVAESPGDPERAKSGPIGLQLHDRFSWVLFRNIRIREIGH